MRNGKDILDDYFLEMRWRCLSLAADLDRVEQGHGGTEVLAADGRMEKLRQALRVVLDGSGDRAEQVQMIFSDKTPPPARES